MKKRGTLAIYLAIATIFLGPLTMIPSIILAIMLLKSNDPKEQKKARLAISINLMILIIGTVVMLIFMSSSEKQDNIKVTIEKIE